jgi:hypothetical protein
MNKRSNPAYQRIQRAAGGEMAVSKMGMNGLGRAIRKNFE